jgi:hypothetical protein
MSAVATGRSASTAADEGSGPERQGLVLATLILVAAVANLNLSVANVALPSIGDAFDSSQTQLDLVAVGYSLGLAGSVLYFGALGDRYGRKLMVILGMSLTIPASLMAALAPSMGVLFAGARLWRPSGWHGLPHHACVDHGALVGSPAHQVDRPLVRDRRRDRGTRAGYLRWPARDRRLGLGVRGHDPARPDRPAAGDPDDPGARQ